MAVMLTTTWEPCHDCAARSPQGRIVPVVVPVAPHVRFWDWPDAGCLADGRRRLWPVPATNLEPVECPTSGSGEPSGAPTPERFERLALFAGPLCIDGDAPSCSDHAAWQALDAHFGNASAALDEDQLARPSAGDEPSAEAGTAAVADDAITVTSAAFLPRVLLRLLQSAEFCLCIADTVAGRLRVMEALWAGCIPVLIVPVKSKVRLPLDDVLDWSKFSVEMSVPEVPSLPTTLQQIPTHTRRAMRQASSAVRRVFSFSNAAAADGNGNRSLGLDLYMFSMWRMANCTGV